MIEMRQYLPSQNRVDTDFNITHRNSNVNRFINIRSKRKILISTIICLLLIILITFLVSYFFLIENSENTDVSSCPINMKTQLTSNQTDFRDRSQFLSIYLLTYNVAGKEPPESLDKLLALNTDRYDVYAVALEELPMLSLVWKDVWRSELEKSFRRCGYVLLTRGISSFTEVFLFVRKTDLQKFYNVRSQTAGLGSGFRFLKGGIGIRFVYDQIKIGILGCHLTPHDENDEQRIKDLKYLNSEIDFGKYGKLNNQDVTFLLGDLNFRLNPILENGTLEQEFRHIVDMIQEGNQQNLASLLQHDQIRSAIQRRSVFIGYQEPPIAFAPTFKFRMGSNCYDDKRRPAWTDRILHRNFLKSQLRKIKPIIAKNDQSPSIDDIETKIINYNSLPEYKISDHKPVRQVAYIPLRSMRQAKIVLRQQIENMERQRRSKTPKTTIFQGDPDPYLGGKFPKDRMLMETSIDDDNFGGANEWKLRSDSLSPRKMSKSSSSSSSSSSSQSSIDETSSAAETFLDLKELWSNVIGPEIFQPRFFIEFYHIPDWNETKRFIAHFRVVEEDENGTRKPVSIHSPEVKRYLSAWDWVGIFPENFVSLDECLTFSYPKFGSAIQAEEASDAMSMLMTSDQPQPGPPSHLAMGDHDQDQSYGDETSLESNKSLTGPSTSFQDDSSLSSTLLETQSVESSSSQTTTGTATEDVLTVYFDENCPILAGRYVLVYVRQNGDIIGISDPFTIENDIDLSSAI